METGTFKIAKWYNNYQAPCVLMIDDLSDAYINVFEQTYKNDWGYLCNKGGSAYDFLKKELINYFPRIKITFFAPYSRHAILNKHSSYPIKKHAIGERKEYSRFLKYLVSNGHEIAHHGSDHGEFIDETKITTVNNWIHEWALFKDVKTGIGKTLEGVKKFRNYCDIDVVGGKYCGYISNEFSREIIDACNFLYWCENANYNTGKNGHKVFGKNKIISFPTNVPGNIFVRLSYKTGNRKKDLIKKALKPFEPLTYSFSYLKIQKLYKKGEIISIQEHISPSTSAGTIQSANIISDIKSLRKIFYYIKKKSIYYATCGEISKYIYTRENCLIEIESDILIIRFDNQRDFNDSIISISDSRKFNLNNDNSKFSSAFVNDKYVVNLKVKNGENKYRIEHE